MSAPMGKPSTYGIEASGWDVNEDFFVELSDLHWSPGGGERLTLHHAVRVGAIVFLRLVHPTALGPSFPVAYQVRAVRRSNDDGAWDLDLAELHSRGTRPQKDESLLLRESNLDLVEQQK